MDIIRGGCYSILDGSSLGGYGSRGDNSSADSRAGQSMDNASSVEQSEHNHDNIQTVVVPGSPVPTNDEASEVSNGGIVRSSMDLDPETRARLVIEQAQGDTDMLRAYMELEQQVLGGNNNPHGGHCEESVRYMDIIHNELERVLSPDHNSDYSGSSSRIPSPAPASMYEEQLGPIPTGPHSASAPAVMQVGSSESYNNIAEVGNSSNLPTSSQEESQGIKHPRSPSLSSSNEDNNKRPRID
jgi:hypothetical protein